MKIIFLCVIAFLFVSSVSAISTNLKAEYERGESIIIEISGNILEPISKADIEFLRGHVSVPLEYDFRRIEGRYFLWAIAPQNANNYSLVIKNVATSSGGKNIRENFMQNFSVGQNLTDYSVKPGFISSSENFVISVQLNDNSGKQIELNFPSNRSVSLKPGKNDIQFDVSSLSTSGFVDIKIGKYNLPTYIISTQKNIPFEVKPSSIGGIAFLNGTITYPFQIINLEDKKLDLSMEYDKSLFSIEREFISLNAKAAIELNLTIIVDIDDKMKKEGLNNSIIVKSGNSVKEIPISITFTEDEGEAETPYLEDYEELVYCPKLGGIVCTAGEICDGETKTSLDGACCIGSCGIEAESSYKPWVGYTIAGTLFLVLVLIYWKYRKTKGKSEFGKRVADAEEKIGKTP